MCPKPASSLVVPQWSPSVLLPLSLSLPTTHTATRFSRLTPPSAKPRRRSLNNFHLFQICLDIRSSLSPLPSSGALLCPSPSTASLSPADCCAFTSAARLRTTTARHSARPFFPPPPIRRSHTSATHLPIMKVTFRVRRQL